MNGELVTVGRGQIQPTLREALLFIAAALESEQAPDDPEKMAELMAYADSARIRLEEMVGALGTCLQDRGYRVFIHSRNLPPEAPDGPPE